MAGARPANGQEFCRQDGDGRLGQWQRRSSELGPNVLRASWPKAGFPSVSTGWVCWQDADSTLGNGSGVAVSLGQTCFGHPAWRRVFLRSAPAGSVGRMPTARSSGLPPHSRRGQCDGEVAMVGRAVAARRVGKRKAAPVARGGGEALATGVSAPLRAGRRSVRTLSPRG